MSVHATERENEIMCWPRVLESDDDFAANTVTNEMTFNEEMKGQNTHKYTHSS